MAVKILYITTVIYLSLISLYFFVEILVCANCIHGGILCKINKSNIALWNILFLYVSNVTFIVD